MRPLLGELLPKVYRECIIRPELIHKVCLGPFTHTVDDGLVVRKAAFECCDTLCAKMVDTVRPQRSFNPTLRA